MWSCSSSSVECGKAQTATVSQSYFATAAGKEMCPSTVQFMETPDSASLPIRSCKSTPSSVTSTSSSWRRRWMWPWPWSHLLVAGRNALWPTQRWLGSLGAEENRQQGDFHVAWPAVAGQTSPVVSYGISELPGIFLHSTEQQQQEIQLLPVSTSA